MLQPIDQTVEDINPLSASLRELSGDLRQPIGFQNVYHVPGRDDLFMRISGGIYAIFPESVYTANRKGKTVTLIPADTVFYIGLPTKLPAPGAAAEHPERTAPPQQVNSKTAPRAQVAQASGAMRTMIDTKMWDVDQRGMPTTLAAAQAAANDSNAAATVESGLSAEPRVRTIVNDSTYRAHRLNELMQQAAAAASRHPS